MLKTLKEYLPITNTGIFSSFSNPVWVNVLPDSAELDTYFYLRYGDRIGNKFIDQYADTDTGIVEDKMNDFAKLIYTINAKRWEHLFSAYMVEYNPIENTDFTETITDTNTNIKVVDSENSNSGTVNTTSGNTSNGTDSASNDVYGFNSSNAVHATANTGTTENTSSTTSETTSSNSGTEDSTVTDNGTHTSEHRKHGNIGVTTNVEMLRSDVDFWWKWSFIDYICQDICDIIALSIY